MKQVIKFRLSGDYALFKKPYANNQPQSFVIPPKTAILGMVGAIMGWSKNEYMLKLPFDHFKYAVKLLSQKIKKDTVGINLMQGKNAKFTFNENAIKNPPPRGQRSPTRYEFLKDMEWEIFLMLDDDKLENSQKIFDILYDRLQEGKFVYNPNLGMQQLFAKIDKVEKLNLKLCEYITDDIYTSFEKKSVDFSILKPVTFFNEIIAVYFEHDRSKPKTKEMISFVGEYIMEINNKNELKNKLYEDKSGRMYQFI